MTTTTTALQALIKAIDENFYVNDYCGMECSKQHSSKFMTLVEEARAALSAPPAAQDAPIERPAGRVLYGDEPLDDQSYTPIAARASQPATPAQDAAATVPVPKNPRPANPAKTCEMSLCMQSNECSYAPCQSPTPAAHPVAGQVQAVPELRERLDMAHDASLDDDHRGCRAILMEIIRMLDAAPTAPQAPALVPLTEHHKLDNDRQVFFYEQDFYVLSNFSSFSLRWKGLDFPTSEHAYHWEKFNMRGEQQAECRNRIHGARSAHDAFKAAAELKQYRRADWDDVKVGIMRDILRAKASQHDYVRRKLLATGDRELVEDSWRDDYWGWGPNRDGQNMLGKLWMEVRAELKAGITPTTKEQQ